MNRAWYSSSIHEFLASSPDDVLGQMARHGTFDLTKSQRDAWLAQNELLAAALAGLDGVILMEYSIPRMGDRIDAIVIAGPVVFVIEFKVGEKRFHAADIDQVMDYALNLHHFHEESHKAWIAPVLVATEAPPSAARVGTQPPEPVNDFETVIV